MKKELSNVWIGKQDLQQEDAFYKNSGKELSLVETLESEEGSQLTANRRDFLKILGFGLGAATIAAGCDIPVKKALPYVVKPDQIVPGVATYYASSHVMNGEYAAILVKTRDGRPIKIESNDLVPNGLGATSSRVQAGVISLYDTNRLKMPVMRSEAVFQPATWAYVDKTVMAALATARRIGVVRLTNFSPTADKAMGEFVAKYPNTTVVNLDHNSYSGILDANQANFGERVIPAYHFDKASVIVSFNADFLGTWVSPQKFASDYVKGRKIEDVNAPNMSRHIQVESGMTMTGSNADNRILVKPSEQGVAIAHLHSLIVGGGPASTGLNEKAKTLLAKAAAELKAAAGKSIVVSGSNNAAEQALVNAINNSLGNYGNTIDFSDAILTRKGDDKALATLIADMKSGAYDVVIIDDINPVYSTNKGAEFAEALAKVKTKVAISMSIDETSSLCDFIAIKTHYLESWGDAQPTKTVLSVVQPTISPLFDSRQSEASYLAWAGAASTDMYDYLKSNWEQNYFGGQAEFASFNGFWDNALQMGFLPLPAGNALTYTAAELGEISKPGSSELEISFYEPISIGNGQEATNPWLQELPNPIDRTVWGNYLAVPVSFDGVRSMVGYNNLEDGDLVNLTIDGTTYQVPIIQQFGQMPGTVSIAMGYGRTVAGACGSGVGVDINPLKTNVNGYAMNFNTVVEVSKSLGKEKEFSCVQFHHTFGVTAKETKTGEIINADEAALVSFDYFTGAKGFQGALTDRSIVYTTHQKDLKENLDELHHKREHAQHLNAQQIYNGYDELYANGHHWGMHIDLNACVGCGACAVACMAENNVPIVGKKEVSRHHEMTWLRIDRYFYGDLENPSTFYQPMMCQHCDNAPCENVCPVNATNHSSEGLNQMTYNRCIGTRYCANNCPYKVRRFNWLDFTTADVFPANQINKFGEDVPYGADNLTRMVLNPDVTVRSKGVIEKCSFCVQRIQEGKLTAKTENRALIDADVKTACQTACSTGAITFGDMNNKNGVLSEKLKSPLNYIVLEEINVRSSVNYTMKVHNRDESFDA